MLRQVLIGPVENERERARTGENGPAGGIFVCLQIASVFPTLGF
ncbi:MAG: hypothetical protein AAF108_07835 [Planctomycetota bacterium]